MGVGGRRRRCPRRSRSGDTDEQPGELAGGGRGCSRTAGVEASGRGAPATSCSGCVWESAAHGPSEDVRLSCRGRGAGTWPHHVPPACGAGATPPLRGQETGNQKTGQTHPREAGSSTAPAGPQPSPHEAAFAHGHCGEGSRAGQDLEAVTPPRCTVRSMMTLRRLPGGSSLQVGTGRLRPAPRAQL